MKKLGLYVHFPFCIKKCHYCDFLSFEKDSDETLLVYAKAMAKDIELWSEKLKDYSIDTIFFGGGTPSLFSKEAMGVVIDAIYKHFHISDNLEFSIEANPKTLNKDKFAFYLSSGINRMSMGVQTLDEKLLNFIGRAHNSEDFYKNYHEARDAGFQNINLDIIFSIPNQRMAHWRNTVEKIIDLKPEHISFYSLQIEENTPFFHRFNAGEWNEIDEEEDRKMYWYGVNKLKSKGYIHYEISNASISGFECRHNLKYWSMEEFLGIGIGAHSYLGNTRLSNETDINKYIQNANNKEDNTVWIHHNQNKDNISEFIFTGLRKRRGINLEEFKSRFDSSIEQVFPEEMANLLSENWIEITANNQMKLTDCGIDISNHIMSEFVIL